MLWPILKSLYIGSILSQESLKAPARLARAAGLGCCAAGTGGLWTLRVRCSGDVRLTWEVHVLFLVILVLDP